MRQVIEDGLCTPYRERRNDDVTAACKRIVDDLGKTFFFFFRFMQAIAVCRFADDIIGIINDSRVVDDRLIGLSQVAREDEFRRFTVFRHIDFYDARTQDMTRIFKTYAHRIAECYRLTVTHCFEMLQTSVGIIDRIHRLKHRLACTFAFAIFLHGIIFLDMSTVGEHDGAQLARCFRRIDLTAEALFAQLRQQTAVVDMRMCQNNSIDRIRRKQKITIVIRAYRLRTLEHPAIYQVLLFIRLQ